MGGPYRCPVTGSRASVGEMVGERVGWEVGVNVGVLVVGGLGVGSTVASERP